MAPQGLLLDLGATAGPGAVDERRDPPFSLPVRVAEHDLAACVDILLENVFAHTGRSPLGRAAAATASAGAEIPCYRD